MPQKSNIEYAIAGQGLWKGLWLVGKVQKIDPNNVIFSRASDATLYRTFEAATAACDECGIDWRCIVELKEVGDTSLRPFPVTDVPVTMIENQRAVDYITRFGTRSRLPPEKRPYPPVDLKKLGERLLLVTEHDDIDIEGEIENVVEKKGHIAEMDVTFTVQSDHDYFDYEMFNEGLMFSLTDDYGMTNPPFEIHRVSWIDPKAVEKCVRGRINLFIVVGDELQFRFVWVPKP